MNKKLLFLCFIGMLATACREFIEPSINNRTVHLLAPTNRLETNVYQQTFWWEYVQDANEYRLQIAAPGFDSINRLILDTLLMSDKFLYTLDPGKYEWRVRAQNGSSATAFTRQSFIIYPSSLKEQAVQLLTPSNDFYSGAASINYQWLNLYGATQYRLQVDNNNFTDTTNLILNQLTENLSFIQSLPKEGNYAFRVRAENAKEKSKWSVVRTLSYDATPPEKVVLSAPANESITVKPVKLLWESITDADKYELFVFKRDSVSLFNNSYPQLTPTNTQTFTFGNSGDVVVWKVRAIDKSGNKGAFSRFYSFTIQ